MIKRTTGLIVYMLLFLTTVVAAAQGTKESAQKPDEKMVYQEINVLFQQRKFSQVLNRIDGAMKQLGMTKRLMHMKYDVLTRMERYDDALRFLDDAIKKTGESEELVSARFNVLLKQGKLPEALTSALRKEKIAKKKSPWDCMNIADIYLRMGSKEEAMDWLLEAVNRGFISYRLLAGKRYESLKNEKRFYEIIKTIHVSIGLGSPARNFQAPMLDGKTFNLYRRKGKVVLLCFWATWCDACIKDLPELKKTYKVFKNLDFELVSISLDAGKKKLTRYIAKKQLDWTHIYSGKGWDDDTVITYGINSVPSYWLIDKNGVVRSFGLKGQELRKTIASLMAK